jgi:nicotinamidase/pyrazinamidase
MKEADMPDALLVIDVQNDFCPGGALPVTNGDAVVPVLNQYIDRATAAGVPIFASRDWHPEQTAHFAPSGGKWPPHCIQGTRGAEFHPGLRLSPEAVVVSKGMHPWDEGYSAISAELPGGEDLLAALREAGVTRVHVGGLATDYCVRATVLDALVENFDVDVLADAIRAVNVNPGDDERALQEMREAGAQMETLAQFHPSRQ